MGFALQDKGDLEASIGSYQQALKIKPDYAIAWNNLEFPLQAMKQKVPAVDKLLLGLDLQTDSKYAQIAKSILSFCLHRGGET